MPLIRPIAEHCVKHYPFTFTMHCLTICWIVCMFSISPRLVCWRIVLSPLNIEFEVVTQGNIFCHLILWSCMLFSELLCGSKVQQSPTTHWDDNGHVFTIRCDSALLSYGKQLKSFLYPDTNIWKNTSILHQSSGRWPDFFCLDSSSSINLPLFSGHRGDLQKPWEDDWFFLKFFTESDSSCSLHSNSMQFFFFVFFSWRHSKRRHFLPFKPYC